MNTNQRNLIAALSLCAAVVPNLASAVAISGQGTWESTLQGRDLDGNLATFEAYYDTVLDITWLADRTIWNTWAAANAWAAGLDINGITGWRLPVTNPVNGSAYNYSIANDGSADRGYNISAQGTAYAGSTGSELAHMFYNTLGNVGYYDTNGSSTGCFVWPNFCASNSGPFGGWSDTYWSATEHATDSAWYFHGGYGYQSFTDKTTQLFAWAVHSGDVGTPAPGSAPAVPVPATVWLFGSGLLGLVGMGRKRRG